MDGVGYQGGTWAEIEARVAPRPSIQIAPTAPASDHATGVCRIPAYARVSGRQVSLLDRLVRLDPQERREVAAIVRRLSETLAEVSDGKTTSHVLGVLAHLLDPS